MLGQFLWVGCRIQKAVVRQGDHHRKHRSHQKENKGPQNDHGDSSMTSCLFEFLSVLYHLLYLLNIPLCLANRLLSRSCSTCPSWPGFLANAGSSIIPWSFTSSSHINTVKTFSVRPQELIDRSDNPFCGYFEAKRDTFHSSLMHSNYDVTQSWESRVFYPIIYWCREKIKHQLWVISSTKAILIQG